MAQSQKTIQLTTPGVLTLVILNIHKGVNMIHYINEMKYTYHIIILIDSKEASDKIQHPLKLKESLLFI